MPKMKSKRGASKRFKATASGKIKRRKGWKSHLLEWKSPKRRYGHWRRAAHCRNFSRSWSPHGRGRHKAICV